MGLIRDSKTEVDLEQFKKEIIDFKVNLDKFETKRVIDDNVRVLDISDLRDAIQNMNTELQSVKSEVEKINTNGGNIKAESDIPQLIEQLRSIQTDVCMIKRNVTEQPADCTDHHK